MAFQKDPSANLDYSQDWSAWLRSGDCIVTSAWTVPSGLTPGTATNTTTVATVWVKGGTIGVTYSLVNHIVTLQGREDSRSIKISIQKR